MKSIAPDTPVRVSVLQLVLAALAIAGGVGGAGYSVGVVYAQLKSHEASEGHPGLEKRVRQNEKTMASVAAVLKLLEQRSR